MISNQMKKRRDQVTLKRQQQIKIYRNKNSIVKKHSNSSITNELINYKENQTI